MPSNIDNYDRLHGASPDENKEVWDMRCVYDGSKHLRIHPMNVSYNPHTISDYSDLPTDVANYYKSLPNVVDAILRIVDDKEPSGFILIENVDTGRFVRGFMNRKEDGSLVKASPSRRKLKEYLNSFYGVDEALLL